MGKVKQTPYVHTLSPIYTQDSSQTVNGTVNISKSIIHPECSGYTERSKIIVNRLTRGWSLRIRKAETTPVRKTIIERDVQLLRVKHIVKKIV